MNNLSELRQEILQRLSQSERFAGVSLAAAYPPARRTDPVSGPVLALGVDSVQCAPGGLGGYWGEREEQALYGSALEVTLRFDLYGPIPQGGEPLYRLYEALCDVLMLQRAVAGVEKLWCGELEQDKTALALHLPVKAALRAALTVPDSGSAVASVQVRRAAPAQTAPAGGVRMCSSPTSFTESSSCPIRAASPSNQRTRNFCTLGASFRENSTEVISRVLSPLMVVVYSSFSVMVNPGPP